MLKLAVFNSIKYSFNKKSRVSNRTTLGLSARSENTLIPHLYLKCWQLGLVVPLREMLHCTREAFKSPCQWQVAI